MGDRLETNEEILKEIEKLMQGISPSPVKRSCRHQVYSIWQIRNLLKTRYLYEQQLNPDVLEPPE